MSKRHNQQSRQDAFEDLMAYAMREGLLDDPFGQSQYAAFMHGANDHHLLSELQRRVHAHARREMLYGRPVFETPKLTHGEIILGSSVNTPSKHLRVSSSAFEGNVLTAASSGGGKNYLAHWLAVQMAMLLSRTPGDANPGMWLISPAKNEFAMLKNAFARVGAELLVLSELKLNPLQPPRGTEPLSFAAQVADLLVSVLEAPPAASRLLEKTICNAYRALLASHGGKPTVWPTLRELRDLVDADKASHPQSRASVVNALDALLASAGEVFDYRLGWDPVDLAEGGFFLALCLQDLPQVAQDLVLNDLVLRLFASRVATGISNPGRILNYILIDEANRLAGADGSGRCALSNLMPVVRGMGVVLHLLVQRADLHPGILANSACKFLGRTTHYADLHKMGGLSMGLTAEQTRYAATSLTPGRWIVQLADSPCGRRPFELQAPNVDFTRVGSAPASSASHAWPPSQRSRLLALPTA